MAFTPISTILPVIPASNLFVLLPAQEAHTHFSTPGYIVDTSQGVTLRPTQLLAPPARCYPPYSIPSSLITPFHKSACVAHSRLSQDHLVLGDLQITRHTNPSPKNFLKQLRHSVSAPGPPRNIFHHLFGSQPDTKRSTADCTDFFVMTRVVSRPYTNQHLWCSPH